MNLYNIVQVLALVPVIYTTCTIIIAVGNFLCVPKLYNIYQKMYNTNLSDELSFDRYFTFLIINTVYTGMSMLIIIAYSFSNYTDKFIKDINYSSTICTTLFLSTFVIYKLYSFIPKLKHIHMNLYNKNIKGNK